jgi:hypothetical protein
LKRSGPLSALWSFVRFRRSDGDCGFAPGQLSSVDRTGLFGMPAQGRELTAEELRAEIVRLHHGPRRPTLGLAPFDRTI